MACGEASARSAATPWPAALPRPAPTPAATRCPCGETTTSGGPEFKSSWAEASAILGGRVGAGCLLSRSHRTRHNTPATSRISALITSKFGEGSAANWLSAELGTTKQGYLPTHQIGCQLREACPSPTPLSHQRRTENAPMRWQQNLWSIGNGETTTLNTTFNPCRADAAMAPDGDEETRRKHTGEKGEGGCFSFTRLGVPRRQIALPAGGLPA